jgi:hypothetical protein
MGYKIVQDAPEQKKYCDYIQNKFDIARKYGAVYDLSDEDIRIQKLYDDNRLEPVDNIRIISRVKAMEDGEQYITVSKTVDFVNKITKTYHDRYSDVEGVTEIPLKITNEAGEEQSSQLQMVYTIPFTKQKAKEYIKKAGSKDVQLRFYTGPITSNRQIIDPYVVGNANLFVEATWEELLLAREKKYSSSRINRLEEIRKEVKTNDALIAESASTHDELNKQDNENINEEHVEEGGTTKTIRVKVPSNTTSKNS